MLLWSQLPTSIVISPLTQDLIGYRDKGDCVQDESHTKPKYSVHAMSPISRFETKSSILSDTWLTDDGKPDTWNVWNLHKTCLCYYNCLKGQ